MFTQSLIAFVALAGYIATPVLAVPGASWVRRQEDAQTSRTLDPAVISEGLKQDGQGDNPDPGQVRSATSVNNFINHCLIALDQGVPLTNGKQIATGSCSQTPMGRIVSLDQSPRSKFVFPKNGDESLVENQAFTVQMKILNLITGNFVNAQSNYYSAPQQVNDQGILIGHSHVTIQAIPDLQTTEPVDPTRFSFFKGFNDAAQNDILTATVTNGLPAGVYRMCSINTAANHQVALVSNAQHGALEDCSYFTVKAAGQTNNNNNASTSASNSNTATATVSESASVSATATQSESASASVTESASVSNGANESSSSAADESSTDANGSTDVPTATESAAPEQSSPAQESDNASQEQPSETFSESSPAPEPTDNGNNNNNGDNGNNNNNGDNGNNNGNGDQGQNNGNTDGNNNNNGNNGENNGNQGNNGSNDNNNNQGNNDQNNGNNGDSSSAASAPTENTGAQDPAASPSADSSSEAPAPEATPAPENGNGDNQNNGDNGAQTPGADTNVPQDPAADNTNNQGGDNQGNNGQN